MKAVILAGGKGTRLAPYTTVFPKPLMPLGEKPILEIIITQLKSQGFTDVYLAVGYLAELIKSYFNDGSQFGVRIHYSKEDSPLGTAGPLALINNLDETFLVMNGDILTTLSFIDLIKYHRQHQGIATIVTNCRQQKVDFGVVKCDSTDQVLDYIEKPALSYTVSTGIYVFEPAVLQHIDRGVHLDFPDLIKKLVCTQAKVMSYTTDAAWLDIGRHDDYALAQEQYHQLKDKLWQ